MTVICKEIFPFIAPPSYSKDGKASQWAPQARPQEHIIQSACIFFSKKKEKDQGWDLYIHSVKFSNQKTASSQNNHKLLVVEDFPQ